MSLIIKDRVKDTTTTTGTGSVTVSGTAPTGFRTFNDAMASSDTSVITIHHQTADEWEICETTYSGSNVLTRGTLLDSSTGSRVSFSAGTKDVWIDFAADKVVDLSRPQTLTNKTLSLDDNTVEYTPAGTGAVARNVSAKLDEIVSPEDFGAAGDGTTDDTTAITNACASFGSAGGRLHLTSGKIYLIDNDFTLPSNVTLLGSFKSPGSTGITNADTVGAFSLGGLRLNSAKTITMSGGSAIADCVIIRKGMTGAENDSSAYAGTALTPSGDDILIENNLIVGFNKLVYSDGCARLKVLNNLGDGVNGIEVIDSFDTSHIVGNQLWPFGTIAASAPVTTFGVGHYQHRDGTGYKFSGGNDYTRVCYNFTFGHTTGFDVADANAMLMVGNGADDISNAGTEFVVAGSKGLYVHGDTDKLVCIGMRCSAKESPIQQNLTTSTCANNYISPSVWYFTGTGIGMVNGGFNVAGALVHGLNNGVGNGLRAYSGYAGVGSFVGAHVQKVANGVNIAADGVSYSNINFGDVGTKFVFASSSNDASAINWLRARKPSNEGRVSTTTLANDANLQFPMAASATYLVRGRIAYATVAAADFKWRHTGPASPTQVVIKRTAIVPGGTSESNVAIDTAYSAADIVMLETSGSIGWIEFDGFIQNGTNAGTFAIQWAQNTSSASATVVFGGSYLEYALA